MFEELNYIYKVIEKHHEYRNALINLLYDESSNLAKSEFEADADLHF